MPSAFKEVVKSAIKELDSTGDLIPVDSLRNSTSFRPYSLLSRKLSRSWFWKSRYKCVNLSIKDILEPGAPEPEPECCGRFQISDAAAGNVQGRMALESMDQWKIAGAAAISGSHSASMNVCILRVTQNTWVVMHQERHLQQPEHKILQQLRSRGVDVFVVTEVLQTEEEMQVTLTHAREGSGQFALPRVTCLQGEGKGHRSRKKMVTIPAGSILAFRVAQLLIDPTWDILLFPDDEKRTFELPSSSHRRKDGQKPRPLSMISGLQHKRGKFRLLTADFRGLRAEVKDKSAELRHFEMELREQLLRDIGRLLDDQPHMEALEASLEQGLCSGGQVEPLDGPAGSILKCLVLPSGELVLKLAEPISYLLGALTALTETQQKLLAEALETRMLLKQLELVEHILEQSTPWQEPSFVSLPLSLLGNSWDEEAPTWVLLEECGLTLRVDTPQVHWEPKSEGPMCALYASLDLLSSLCQMPS
ncbi:gasdermin-D-like [Peromyscus maniculatus bairdii]|uniref:gasdermin-D-like n=1 Tax=Peromyscus maniculatus bairdii TaxID=230844 RepID=UPI003FD51792